MSYTILTFASLSALYLKAESLKALPSPVKVEIVESSCHTRDDWNEHRNNFLTKLIFNPTHITLRMLGIAHQQSVTQGKTNERV
ncbi:MAG: hypothetical protein H7281_06780 [Bacteriovorax sp.]|nr:hypothetical protein [Bacteriovorax sp.]